MENTTEFVALLTEVGYDVGFVEFDGGHEVPTELAIPTIMELLGP